MTIKDRVVELLQNHPEGLSTEEVMAMLSISKQAVYSAIHGFNKEKSGQKIENVNLKYKFSSKKQITNTPATIDENTTKHPLSNITLPAGVSLPAGYAKKLKTLSPDDVNNFCDMLKKSIFYQKSAAALVEANDAVNVLRESLMFQGGL